MSEKLDLVWGAEAIGRVLNVTPRKASYLLVKKAIPARKVRGCWVAELSTLKKFFGSDSNTLVA